MYRKPIGSTHTLVSWSGVETEWDLDGALEAWATALQRVPGDDRFMLSRIGQRVTSPDPLGNGTPARASRTLDFPLLWSPITHILFGGGEGEGRGFLEISSCMMEGGQNYFTKLERDFKRSCTMLLFWAVDKEG